MSDSLYEALWRDRDIIASCDTIDQYERSSLTRNPEIYKHYAWWEKAYNTVKCHPDIHIGKTLLFPTYKKASDLFEFCYLVYDGVGNANHAPRMTNTYFISDLHCEYRPIELIKEKHPEIKGKPFKCVYVKPNDKLINWSEGGLCTSLGSFELAERHNPITRKTEWLVNMIDRTMIGHNWITLINEWDVKEIKP